MQSRQCMKSTPIRGRLAACSCAAKRESCMHLPRTHPFPGLPCVDTAGSFTCGTTLSVFALRGAHLRANRSSCSVSSFLPTARCLQWDSQTAFVKIIDAATLSDLPSRSSFRISRDSLTRLCFSADSSQLATADADFCVTLYGLLPDDTRRDPEGDYGEVPELVWTYVGKYRAHTATITGIMFGISGETGLARLVSLGADRNVVEYDLSTSSTTEGLRVRSVDRIEQSSTPTAMVWYPPVTKEGFILVANDRLKLKLFNATTLMCRQTVLGPTFGGAPARLSMLPCARGQEEIAPRFLAYATTDRIIGLVMVPLEGHPHTSMAVIAHPGEVTALACTYDGSHVITAGGKDGTVNFWRVNIDVLKAASRLGGEGMDPYLSMVEGGRNGEFFKELEDYFYYAQVRNLGEDTMAPREVTSRVPVGQVPSIMRALGFFPSEQQVEDIVNEVKFSSYVDTQEYVRDVNLEQLVKLYVNHRPVFGISSDELEEAFAIRRHLRILPRATTAAACHVRAFSNSFNRAAKACPSLSWRTASLRSSGTASLRSCFRRRSLQKHLQGIFWALFRTNHDRAACVSVPVTCCAAVVSRRELRFCFVAPPPASSPRYSLALCVVRVPFRVS
eukprot:Opistho-2@48652